jgi:hypothetical protein
MKTFFSILILFFSLTVMSQNQYTREWKQVDSLAGLGQAQTALDLVTRIYDQTKAANQPDQFVKASVYRMKLESDFEEDYFENSIARTQSDIQSAKAPVKQILHSIAAELYWRYYQNNRWQILSRSETAGLVSDDLKTWDVKKLVSASMENYALSLEDKELLKNTPLSAFDEILIKQKDSQKLRPTLFDFLAHRAIDFYSSSEAGLTKPAATFIMNQQSYFAPSNEFAALNITSPDAFSFEFQALKLLQEIVGIHLLDKDPTALIDAEIKRLSFVHEKSVLPEKDSLYLEALYKLESRFKNHPSSTEVAYEIAIQLDGDDEEITPYDYDETESVQPVPDAQKWNKKRAIEICEAAINRFPDSFGAKNCQSLIERIKRPGLSITTNYASFPGKPSLALAEFNNMSKVYFRLLKIDPETDRVLRGKQQEERFAQYLSMKVEKAWEQVLPDDGDYRDHSAEIKLPAMPQGYYVLLSSNDGSFPAKSAIVTANSFWETTISYLNRRTDEGNNEIVVLHRETGQPLEGVKVQPFYNEYNSKLRKYESTAGEVFVTDKSGMVTIPAKSDTRRNNQFYLVFTSKTDKLITEEYFSGYTYRSEEPRTVVQTHFFTDRAIYRPGQTIFFKGIVLERKGDDVKIKTRFKTEVTLYDVNGQVVSKQMLTTNDFGSFSGNFVAPQGVLTGQMTIRCETGSTYFQVEEYKRPKFEVTFEPVKGSYKLGETIVVKGKASWLMQAAQFRMLKFRTALCGRHVSPIGGDGVVCPGRKKWKLLMVKLQPAVDGTFTVTFKAIPDLYSRSENRSAFHIYGICRCVGYQWRKPQQRNGYFCRI